MAQFKAKNLKLIKDIELSSTQSIRVNLIDTDPEDPNSRLVIGLQKYWRKADDTEWKAGKGFFLDYDTAQLIIQGLETAVETLEAQPEDKPSGGWKL